MKRAWLAMMVVLGMGVSSGGNLQAGQTPCGECPVVADRDLAEIRGGYITGDGLKLTFGIETRSLVDGMVQSVNTLILPQTGAVLGQLTGDAGSVNLIRNGQGNVMDPAVLAGLQSGQFTFIQNSLDNVRIQNITRIDASVTVLHLFRDMNLGAMMNQQAINSLR